MQNNIRILYVGFKGNANSSHEIVKRMDGDKLFLTNSFNGLKKDIQSINKKYDRIYMFGLDKDLNNCIKIEKSSYKDGQFLDTSLDLLEIQKKFLSNNINCTICEKPTAYLCNEAYFYMLEKFKNKVVFIHIPSLHNMNEIMIEGILSSL